MKPNTTWNDLAQYSIGGEIKESDFNEVVGKAGFDVGPHEDITISSVEPGITKGKDGNTYVYAKLTMESAEGAKLYYTLFPVDRETGGMSKMLRALLSSLTKDKSLLVKFGSMVKADLSNLAAMAGMKTSFIVAAPRNGAEVIMVDGVIAARDITTGEVYGTFTTFKEASDFLKENGHRRGYNEIKSFKAGSENADILSKVVESVKPAAKPVAIRRQAL